MNEMIKAERDKICSRKQTRILFIAGIILIIAYFFFFQFNYQRVFYNYDLGKMESVSGFSAIEQRKEIAGMFEENALPNIASYFNDYNQIVFDAKLTISLDDKHIFEDGLARGRLPKYKEKYHRFKDSIEEKEKLLSEISRDFDSALARTKMLAERNYKLAIPQYRKETGEIQFLLPIYLGEQEEYDIPQCALVISLDNTNRIAYYKGKTILTLDMAYNNARLIAKPDIFWLDDLLQ